MTEPWPEALFKRGRITWASSDEDSGPDVGLWLGLGNRTALWAGEITKAAHAETPGASDLGSDQGWWLMLCRKDGHEVLGRFIDADQARSFVEMLHAALDASGLREALARERKLLVLLEAAQEELRLIRMKDTNAVYNPALRTQISTTLAYARGETP